MTKLTTTVFQNPVYFLAFGFGTGLLPKAPGTWGTLAAIPLYLLLAGTPWWVYLAVTMAAFLLGVMICSTVSTDLGVGDYPGIVWDEVVGFLLTLFLVPVSVYWMLAGFVLFRVFDIWKPQPIRFVDQHVHGGLGIMLDDVLAAIPAWILLQGLVWVWGLL